MSSDPSRRFDEKLAGYAHAEQAKSWFDRNWARLKELFSNVRLRDFVFEPIKGVFSLQGQDEAAAIRQSITMVAVANAVMAGLPGKMGVGVAVSIALEGWMAFVIASCVGVVLREPSDVWKYFGLLAAVGATVLYGIRALLGVAFSLFSVVPGINPMILAELLVTNLVGVLFWIGFEEAKRSGSFAVPLRALGRIGQETKSLVAFQWGVLRDNLNPAAIRLMGTRLKAWLTGEIAVDRTVLRGQVAPAAMMAFLLAGRRGELDGPVGQEFLQAIRDRYPELQDADVDQIAARMREYGPEELAGVVNMVKGKLFERLVAHHENADSDSWRAMLHEDQSYPGSDITFVNDDTGEAVEVSLKATDSASCIEHALLRYPDTPVLTTEEVGAMFGDDPRVSAAALSNEDLTEVTKDNFDSLLGRLTPWDVAQGASAGVAVGASLGLWPFVLAFMRGRITQDQLEQACVRVVGESGVALASRLAYALVLGPVFAWYLLARGAMAITRSASGGPREGMVRRLAASVHK
jgi:hypothetical protein